MSDPQAEVRIRLVIDGAAEETAKKIEASLGGVAAAAKKAGDSTAHDAKSAEAYLASLTKGLKPATSGFENMKYVVEGSLAAVAAGVASVGAGVAIAGDLAHTAFEAALEEGKAVKQVSSSLMMMANENASLGQIKNVAGIVHGEMEDLGIAIGVSTDAMDDAFNTIAERSSKSVAEVQKLTESMALAGKATSSGLGGLSEGFAMMESGMIRARNPVVQLIAATGTLHGNAKQVASQLQKMSPEKALELGEKAVEKMAAKMRGLPMGYGALKQSMADIKSNIYEDMGAPILKAVTTELRAVQKFFAANADLVTEYAVAFGNRIAEFIKFVSDFLKTLLGLEEQKAGAVAKDLSGLIEDFADRWDDIKDNGVALARAFKDVVDAAEKIVEKTMLAARVTAAIVTLGGSEAARYVGKKGYEYVTETGSFAVKGSLDSNTERALHKLNKISGDMNAPIEKMQKAQEKFREAAQAAGMSAEEIKKYIQGALDVNTYAISSGGGEGFHQAAVKAKTDDFGGAADFVMLWQAATKAHNDGAKKHAEMVFEKSVDLQRVLIESGMIASGALEGFGGDIKNAALKSRVSDEQKKAIAGAAGKGAAITMNGGQTFQIKQDFKDQDPDRVFVTFRRDVSKAAAARTQSNRSGVFGA